MILKGDLIEVVLLFVYLFVCSSYVQYASVSECGCVCVCVCVLLLWLAVFIFHYIYLFTYLSVYQFIHFRCYFVANALGKCFRRWLGLSKIFIKYFLCWMIKRVVLHGWMFVFGAFDAFLRLLYYILQTEGTLLYGKNIGGKGAVPSSVVCCALLTCFDWRVLNIVEVFEC